MVTRPTSPFPIDGGALRVHQIPSWVDNLIWLLEDPATRRGVVVDGPEAGPVDAYAEAHGIEVVGILNTHTHPDHIGINRAYAKAGKLETLRVVGAASRDDVPGRTEGVREGDEVQVGPSHGRVLETPGHIDGHISFLFGEALFCGDTLFAGGCGYLFDGPPATMHASLQKLAALPDTTLVCCAHEYTEDNLRFAWSVEPDNEALAARIREVWKVRADGGCTVPSTIAIERATNPFLRPHSEALRQRVAAAFPDRALETDADVFAATRALKDRKDYKDRGDDDLPL